jgi:predicted esterase
LRGRITEVIKSPDGAALSLVSSPATVNALVLVLHGGTTRSQASAKWRNLPVLRLWPVARVIARKVPTAAVYRLRFAVRGWNGDGAAAIRDARWAMAAMRERHPDLPVVVVGHSMGGRTALHVGGDQQVAGVVLLAPWTPPEDPAGQVAGRPVVLVQGGRDRTTPDSETRHWMARAELAGAHG